MDHNIELASHIFLLILNILQILANLVILVAYFTNNTLLANQSLILLVSLAAIDFLYSALSIPYLTALLYGWVPDGKNYDYNQHVIFALGAGPSALMKSGCTITTLIALDRICAMLNPMKYYSSPKKLLFCAGFVFALVMAGIDLSLVFILSNDFKKPYGCCSFRCFTSQTFSAYWGMSNMIMNLLSCLLTIVALTIKNRKIKIHNNAVMRRKEDKWASQASFYILIVSAVFGVVPGGINGFAERTQSNFLRGLAFYIQLCASISGLSHAFIFGMAHNRIRQRIIVMLKLNGCFKQEPPRLLNNCVFPRNTFLSAKNLQR